MCVTSLKYAAFGRVFGVEQVEATGRWIAMGRARGMSNYALDKIGDADAFEPMQHKLDAWARRQGCRPINIPAAPSAEQLSLKLD